MTLKTNELSIPNIRAQTRIIIHYLTKDEVKNHAEPFLRVYWIDLNETTQKNS